MKGGDDLRLLRQAEIFRGVDDDELRALLALSRQRSYRRNEFISGAEQGRDDVLLVLHGRARLYRLSHGGREITLATLQPGDAFGVVFVDPTTQPKSSVRAMLSPTVVYHVPRRQFRRFIAAHPQIALNLIAVLSRRLVDAYDRIEDISFSQLNARLAHELARLARAEPGHIVSITREELATLTGASREEVTKALHDLRDRGLVHYRPYSRTIAILDPERLAAE